MKSSRRSSAFSLLLAAYLFEVFNSKTCNFYQIIQQHIIEGSIQLLLYIYIYIYINAVKLRFIIIIIRSPEKEQWIWESDVWHK
jgi:hypothetical protein